MAHYLTIRVMSTDYAELFTSERYNTHGHKLRFPAFEKAQFVTECGIDARRQPQ
jgi:hypothetical protein